MFVSSPSDAEQAALDITERSAYAIVRDLAEAGYIVKEKDGRRNRYQIHRHLPLRESTHAITEGVSGAFAHRELVPAAHAGVVVPEAADRHERTLRAVAA